MKLLRELIKEALLLEAKENAEFLIKLNYDKLKKKNPDKHPKELLAKARDIEKGNPNVEFDYYTKDIIEKINALPERDGGYDRPFIKWLAEEMKFRDFFLFDHSIYDWYLGDETAKSILNTLDYKSAHKKSREWHESLMTKDLGASVKEQTNEEMSFDGGYKLKELKSKSIMQSVGVSMGICITGAEYKNAMVKGSMRFFTLFDHDNVPVVTVNVITSNNEVEQIKGIKNAVPEQKHAKLVRQWLDTTKFQYETSDDYINVLSEEEKIELIITSKKLIITSKKDNLHKMFKIISSFNLSNYQLTKLHLGAVLSCTRVVYVDINIRQAIENALATLKDWTDNKESLQNVKNEYKSISEFFEDCLINDNLHINEQQRLLFKVIDEIMSIHRNLTNYEFFLSLEDNIERILQLADMHNVVASIEKFIQMPIEDFIISKDSNVE